jgi:predicted phosphate transport protein (TIGR00153 family)
MPKSYIFSLFGASPIRPLQHHMAKVQVTIAELLPFFDAVFAGDWAGAERLQHRISDLENEADTLKKELRLHLPSGWMMAMSRRDVLEVLTVQDQIANKAKDIAGLVLGRKMDFPADMRPKLLEFIKRSIDASAQAQRATNELDELVETGFRGGEVKLVESMLRELDAIESDTDKLQVEVRGLLYVREKELHPVDVMFIYRVIEWIGDLGNLAQRVGSRLQLMLAR